MTCPDCREDLDRVPANEPCPECGGRRRTVTVTSPGLSALTRVGEVRAVVQEALDELAGLPVEAQLQIAGKLLQTSCQ